MDKEIKETVSPSTLETKETVKNAPAVEDKSPSTLSKETAPVKKKKGKPRGGNNWLKPENMLSVEEGDNTKYLSLNVELMNMPNIDMENVSEVQKRLSDYFTLYGRYDTKPTVAGMAIALNGHSRQWLWAVVHNAPLGGMGNTCTLPPEVTDSIKKAYFLMENLWENYMQNGKVNPVAGIFLGKNNYGYQDKTEYVLTPNQQNDNDYSADEIRQRYIQADQQKRLSTSDSDTEND